MRIVPLLLCGVLPVVLQGCAIHPLQQDVTSIKTTALVNHIRCEARDAIISKALTLLEFNHGEHGRLLARELSADKSKFVKFDKSLLDKQELEFYNNYINTAIAYNFTFDITEDNNAGATIDLIKPLTYGAFSLGIGAGADFNRENLRRFVVGDTFKELLDHPSICDENQARPNFAYPIEGEIGLHELIDTFIDLNEDKQLNIVDNAQVFADTLTFKTMVSASAAPKIVSTVRGTSFQFVDAPLTGAASRLDKHQVIIGLSLGKTSGTGPRRRAPNRDLVETVLPSLRASDKGDNAKSRAIQATEAQRFNTFLDKF